MGRRVKATCNTRMQSYTVVAHIGLLRPVLLLVGLCLLDFRSLRGANRLTCGSNVSHMCTLAQACNLQSYTLAYVHTHCIHGPAASSRRSRPPFFRESLGPAAGKFGGHGQITHGHKHAMSHRAKSEMRTCQREMTASVGSPRPSSSKPNAAFNACVS